MNIKKILASAAASVLAVSSMAVVASAGNITASIPFKDDGSGNWQLMLAGEDAVSEAADLDVTKIASFDLTLTFDDGSSKGELDEDGNLVKEWAGGAIILQSDSLGWNQDLGQWENSAGNGKEIEDVESGKPIHCVMPASFTAEDGYAAITFQSYGIDVDLTAITLYDADGATLLSLGGTSEPPAESTPEESTPAESTPADDTSKPNTDTGVEGIAAVLGVAVVAGGAMIVAKKRK